MLRTGDVRDSWCDMKGAAGGDPDEEPEEDFDENDPDTLLLIVQYVDMPPKSPLGPIR
jgi:hypothetical protein